MYSKECVWDTPPSIEYKIRERYQTIPPGTMEYNEFKFRWLIDNEHIRRLVQVPKNLTLLDLRGTE